MATAVNYNPHFKSRLIAMNEADAEAFGTLLREAFPDIHFLRHDYWKRFEDGRTIFLRPPDLAIPYYSSLASPDEDFFLVWREPPDWQPDWQGPNKDGIYVIANEPRLQFVFDSGRTVPPKRDRVNAGRIWARYEPGDKEHVRFLNRVWRLNQKLTTNILKIIDPQTGAVINPRCRDAIWAGFNALQWCREDPSRVIDGNRRPVD